MKPLRFGFVLDDMCLQGDIPNTSYWPNKLCSMFNANKTYFYCAPGGTGYKLVDAINSGRITEALNANIDILICHLGVFDMFSETPDAAGADTACREIIRQCQNAGTKVLFIDYGRCQPVIENHGGWCFNNIKIVHDYFVNMNEEFPDDMAHSDLWWAHQLQWRPDTGYWRSDGVNYTLSGHHFIADRLRGAILPLVQHFSNEKFVTYACIGDSWTDTDTCVNAFDHWTRLVGDGIGAKLVCDASVGGWTVEGLYNNQLIMGDVDQITWALSKHPDMIFTTIGGNDTWSGYKPETKTRMRTVINRLIDGGVKKILWSFYAQIGWAELVASNSQYQSVSELKSRFEKLRTACWELAAEFPEFVVFNDGGMGETQLDYSLHPENYNNGADTVHPHNHGWTYLSPYLINAFGPTYNSLRDTMNKPKINFGTESEWLGNEESNPYIQIGTDKLCTPFRRKKRSIMSN